MSEIAITEARARLASIIDEAREEPVYLTRRNLPVAAVVDASLLERLLEDAEELADIRAVDAAWDETAQLDETPIPWEEVKRDLGLVP
ncbi:type II toxin-antitoxin system Phd/YefM family antitoxin [Microbacterium sp. p3-SID338]|uniref:type II toxin-antitoxin system Phd/YefM family antitoxin n=1 Tax=unclassified Microbacterium TaxID=2609290 RepID=UPI000789701D|nr:MULTISPECIES: type II toxin-antitoxin system Phd/YefM family antitoxin [unclassified Microbacterium]KYJ96759.1 prevent-host-death protein [Microbacterium sp. CH1]MCT1397249.1 type II toxin-antitoxin system Phd/YefM family antitoxin [Microbacterium sp. p3-SID338]PMC05019.1 type II toxin-antitoxin system Phd/YefM family antitoxin [Microbacterium sp. UMB0228]